MCQQCNASRTGDSWSAFLTQFKIRNICNSRDGWSVESTSGHTYTVRSETHIDRYDGGLEFRLICNCPARGRCRHIDAVEQMRYVEALAAARDGDTDGMEVVERTR